ncbi:helix-turn-helix transcriptional regulator [Neptunomonas phycophila]|uniref:helix-turn-helix transcriptional regulator n=1 Tax=Neptunomonas phycophila TaxID=1572645 RepID=UPI0026E1C74C|nr:helix-turn-helix transcriptional regulator [Neptunomonas phycophila]MDO6469849.1 helix-turn-helix transcriptional regulator [Neptunomonas phycophila]
MNEHAHPFMNVRQLSEYLDVNEKKVYSMAAEGKIPATKVTGKWLFPRALIDRWLLDNAHRGLMADRLLLSGSDDPLLQATANRLTQQLKTQAMIGYTVTGTKLGLDLLAQGSSDATAIHWGRAEESRVRHPALLQQYSESKHWVLVHLFERQHGLMVRPQDVERFTDPRQALTPETRWVVRQEGAGSQRFLGEWLAGQGFPLAQLTRQMTAFSEREVARLIAKGEADIGPGTLSAAQEMGLVLLAQGAEAFDLVVTRPVYFRKIVQHIFEFLQSREGIQLASSLRGYNTSQCGKLIWSAD